VCNEGGDGIGGRVGEGKGEWFGGDRKPEEEAEEECGYGLRKVWLKEGWAGGGARGGWG